VFGKNFEERQREVERRLRAEEADRVDAEAWAREFHAWKKDEARQVRAVLVSRRENLETASGLRGSWEGAADPGHQYSAYGNGSVASTAADDDYYGGD
jgi:hypothetical protein